MKKNIKSVWIVGLGGIGKAINDLLIEQGIEVNCYSRNSTHPINIVSESSVTELVENSKLPDLIIITAGLLHNEFNQPEKSVSSVEKEWLDRSISINVLPTLFFAKALTRRIKRTDNIVLASFSARVSSISDNRLGGWHSYRMSKCMLNMLIKNVAIEWRIKSPNSTIFGYHPGTVDTPLSKPFQRKIPADQLFSTKKAANLFFNCLETRTPKHSGKVFDWDQKEVYP